MCEFYPESSNGNDLSWGCDLNTFGFETAIAEAVIESKELGNQLAKEGCGL